MHSPRNCLPIISNFPSPGYESVIGKHNVTERLFYGAFRTKLPGKVFFSGLGGNITDPLQDDAQKIPSVRLEFSVIAHNFF